MLNRCYYLLYFGFSFLFVALSDYFIYYICKSRDSNIKYIFVRVVGDRKFVSEHFFKCSKMNERIFVSIALPALFETVVKIVRSANFTVLNRYFEARFPGLFSTFFTHRATREFSKNGVLPVQDSRRQATEGQSQSVRSPEPRLKITLYQRSILVGYVDRFVE
jgi:hypothetical protein